MNTVQIKIVANYKAKGGVWFHAGEKYNARRLTIGVLDLTTPFQLIDGNRSGHEIPYKNAIELKEIKTYNQKQYDEILAQRDNALSDLAKHGQTIVELQNDKLALLNTVERAVTHNEIQALPRSVVQALESFKRNGDDLDTVIAWMIQAEAWMPEIDVLRRYALQTGNGYQLIAGMVNGYVVEPQLEDPSGIAETVLEWWKEHDIEAKESDLEKLVDRLRGHIAERQTVQ